MEKEKILDGVQHCVAGVRQCGACPYREHGHCEADLCHDILDLVERLESMAQRIWTDAVIHGYMS